MSGAITRNEVRAAMGLDPMQWGEQPLVPNNMVEVDPRTGKPVADSARDGLSALTPGPKGIGDLIVGQKALVDTQTKLAAAVEEIARRLDRSHAGIAETGADASSANSGNAMESDQPEESSDQDATVSTGAD